MHGLQGLGTLGMGRCPPPPGLVLDLRQAHSALHFKKQVRGLFGMGRMFFKTPASFVGRGATGTERATRVHIRLRHPGAPFSFACRVSSPTQLTVCENESGVNLVEIVACFALACSLRPAMLYRAHEDSSSRVFADQQYPRAPPLPKPSGPGPSHILRLRLVRPPLGELADGPVAGNSKDLAPSLPSGETVHNLKLAPYFSPDG